MASLNHPNICSLFDIGPGYMVLELVDGETLAERIGKGALPLDQALKYAPQIAVALDVVPSAIKAGSRTAFANPSSGTVAHHNPNAITPTKIPCATDATNAK